MATDAANDITYVLTIPTQHVHHLGNIRHWVNLRMAADGNEVFVRDFTQAQLDSVDVKSIPYKSLYALRDQKLFPYGSALPSHRIPSSLLWSPMDRALPVTLPSFNHNYFGVQQQVSVTLVPLHEEKPAVALWVSLKSLAEYLAAAPTVRLKNLSWVLLDGGALVMGTPLLPLQGDTFWQMDDFLVPAGYGFDLPGLCPTLNGQLNPQRTHWVVWDTRSRYFLLEKANLRPLSLGAFRLSQNSVEPHFNA